MSDKLLKNTFLLETSLEKTQRKLLSEHKLSVLINLLINLKNLFKNLRVNTVCFLNQTRIYF